MKIMTLALILIIATVSMAAIGCGGQEDATPTPTGGTVPTTTPTATAGQPTPTAPPGTTPAPGSTDPVNFNRLIAFLPDAPSGWQADDPQGGTIQMQEWAYSQVSRDYTHQTTDEYVSVAIYDSAYYYNFGWWQAWEFIPTYEGTDGYVRTTTVEGHRGWQTYDTPDSYALVIAVADRFMVIINSETEGSLNQFSDMMDYGGIAALR